MVGFLSICIAKSLTDKPDCQKWQENMPANNVLPIICEKKIVEALTSLLMPKPQKET